MPENVLLKFMDGGDQKATLARPFKPSEEEIDVHLDGGIRLAYPLYDLCCILLSKSPDWAEGEEVEDGEEIEITTGERLKVHILDQDRYREGIFALTTEKDGPYKSAFFTRHGIRVRLKDYRIGAILEEKGLVPPHAVKEALDQQQELRKRTTGEIIAEQNDLARETIEKTIEAARKHDTKPRARVGEILVEAGLVTKEQVEEALSTQKDGKKKKIGTLLIDLGLITESQLLSALATKFDMRVVDLDDLEPDMEAIGSLSKGIAARLQVFPIEAKKGNIVVATAEPTDPTIGDILRFNTNRSIELVIADSKQIARAIDLHYVAEQRVEELIGEMAEEVVSVEEEVEQDQFNEADSKVIKLVNRILIDADKKGASDIHFEPGVGRQPFRIRYRVDGICHVAHQISATFKTAMIARLKIISKLDIAEHRRPQSGKIMIKSDGRKVEYRLEITPTVGGQEDAVLRILADAKPLPLEQMGFSSSNQAEFEKILAKPYGIILCVGPTGSGKTTTLHSALGHINTPDRKIWTAEDPVEITQTGLRQVQVNPKIGFRFQDALRSFLRADPDVIMIGEMRDAETAKAAIEASLTGHLVFSTLHTNSAPETVVRLIEMGMDPISFAEAMLGILAQRLARRLCPKCKEAYRPDREEYEELVEAYGREAFAEHGLPAWSEDLRLLKKVGCEECNGGYKGRIAVHELLTGTEAIKKAIKKQATAEALKELAIEKGMTTLKMDGIQKIFQGYTDLDQILRVCL